MELTTYFIVFLIIVHFNSTNSSVCNGRDTCAVNKNKNVPLCYCDLECQSFKDCCGEYLSDEDNYHDQHNTTRQNCVLLTNEMFLVNERVGAFMIDHCNSTFEPCMLKENDLKSMVPVSSDENTYLNNECALCNGIRNFRYWKAVFDNTDANTLFQISRKGIKEEKVKEFLTNETKTNSQKIFFHPPIGFRPRFCPYDVFLAKPVVSSRDLHQHPLYCNEVFYKNVEECKADGCCRPDDNILCINLILPHYGKGDSMRGGDNGMQVIFNFGTLNSKKDTLQKSKETEPMIVKNMIVHMIFEVHAKFDRSKIISTELDDCIQGILLLYRSKPYYLMSIWDTYTTAYLGNGTHISLHHFQSQASLNAMMINKLLGQNITFTCHTKIESKLIVNIKVDEAANVQEYFSSVSTEIYDTKQELLIKTGHYVLKNPDVEENCDNMILKFEEKGSKTIVHVGTGCVDDKEISDKLNGTQLPVSSFLTLAVTFAFLLGL